MPPYDYVLPNRVELPAAVSTGMSRASRAVKGKVHLQHAPRVHERIIDVILR